MTCGEEAASGGASRGGPGCKRGAPTWTPPTELQEGHEGGTQAAALRVSLPQWGAALHLFQIPEAAHQEYNKQCLWINLMWPLKNGLTVQPEQHPLYCLAHNRTVDEQHQSRHSRSGSHPFKSLRDSVDEHHPPTHLVRVIWTAWGQARQHVNGDAWPVALDAEP
jgi:hypothetical protein